MSRVDKAIQTASSLVLARGWRQVRSGIDNRLGISLGEGAVMGMLWNWIVMMTVHYIVTMLRGSKFYSLK